VNGEHKGWAENPKVLNRLFWALVALCVALVPATALIHEEGHFPWERWFAFYAIFGFIAYAFIVFAGKAIRKVLMRDEDYYDR
jgi:hypothetical protein